MKMQCVYCGVRNKCLSGVAFGCYFIVGVIKIWRVGGMTLKGENQSAGRKTCHNATMHTTYLISTGLGSKPVVRGGIPAIKHL
jgi:hypothetical protein